MRPRSQRHAGLFCQSCAAWGRLILSPGLQTKKIPFAGCQRSPHNHRGFDQGLTPPDLALVSALSLTIAKRLRGSRPGSLELGPHLAVMMHRKGARGSEGDTDIYECLPSRCRVIQGRGDRCTGLWEPSGAQKATQPRGRGKDGTAVLSRLFTRGIQVPMFLMMLGINHDSSTLLFPKLITSTGHTSCRSNRVCLRHDRHVASVIGDETPLSHIVASLLSGALDTTARPLGCHDAGVGKGENRLRQARVFSAKRRAHRIGRRA